MNYKKILISLLVVLAVLLAVLGMLIRINARNYVIDRQLYPKDAESLDLRGKEITVQHYETVRQVLPNCEIIWDVPLQEATYPSDSREVKVTDLVTEIALLDYFPNLETVDITACGDLSALPELKKAKPEVKLQFKLTVDGKTYTQDSTEVTLTDVGEKELILLQAMENLKHVTVCEGGETSGLAELAEFSIDHGIETDAVMNGLTVSGELTLEYADEEQISLLMLASDLKKLHLMEPEATGESLQLLRGVLHKADISWEKTFMGLTFHSDDTEIDLTPVIALDVGQELGDRTAYQIGMEQPVMGKQEEVPSTVKILKEHPMPNRLETTHQLIEETDAFMDYFPEAEKLVLCGALLDDEAMAQYREECREEYKVVWTVMCGQVATRTDATFFMPTKYHIEIENFVDWHAYNLRYCEDIVSIDLGHSSITDLRFVEYMPDLTYLDVALTLVQDLSPLASCKNLVFLVMHTMVRELDFTPLKECTSLQDLNIGSTTGDITPVLEMTNLKNLWIPNCSEENLRKVWKTESDVNIVYYKGNSNSGWRSLPNYFRMRDAMLMFYMS